MEKLDVTQVKEDKEFLAAVCKLVTVESSDETVFCVSKVLLLGTADWKSGLEIEPRLKLELAFY